MAAFLPAWRLGLAAAALAAPVLVVSALGVRMERQVAMAATRALVQLTLLGAVVLAPLMRSTSPTLTFAYVGFMIVVAGREAASKLSWSYAGIGADCLLAAGGGAGVAACCGIAMIIQPSPWYSAQTVIPVCGMVLGNGLSAVGVGLRTFLANIGERPEPIQLAIGLGASKVEAVTPAVADAVLTAMIPKINSMTVAGLVSIPGMMTGQVLAGQDPSQASRYQIMILYLIAAGSLMSVMLSLGLASWRLVDSAGRLRVDLLDRPKGLATSTTLEGVTVDRALQKAVVARVASREGEGAGAGVSSGPPVLMVAHLEVYAGGRPLFELDGFVLHGGQICGVTGPSGAGKSSLLGALAMTLPPDRVVGAGGVALHGRGFDDLGGSAWRAGCLAVPQAVPPLPGVTCADWFASVLEYAVWGHHDPRATTRRMVALAQDLLLTATEIETKELSHLSGGERHRAVLACALALAPDVLLLDEPTAALDPKASAAVEDCIAKFAAGGACCVVLVSHDAELVGRMAHLTVVVGGGRQ